MMENQKKPHIEAMGSVEKNMGFIFNSRVLDAALTMACVCFAALGIMMADDMMVAFAVPAGIGLFRQFAPLLTFPYVVSIFISGVLLSSSLGVFESIGF